MELGEAEDRKNNNKPSVVWIAVTVVLEMQTKCVGSVVGKVCFKKIYILGLQGVTGREEHSDGAVFKLIVWKLVWNSWRSVKILTGCY